ncbi:helix-turn-helix transcriptional regulator [Cyanobacterium aponinum UTEX 3222]|uniref:helix-turn-helix domain-containing protein n=1 Tax=Cyanobacterium aponinum TaxID=379064 RepID=UPI002B4C22AE|nr:helix-turn-helix transcriptional regulator [Cyanobacterium aponinum]WRL37041.1 helix-turn-helix transcriptional regulator [Cyanobacterium aponinum UTEX 3221]WRL43376.1 helix-turn-helix transcriptional regulator [Cyanobacterium aponinum UTEX 3222]
MRTKNNELEKMSVFYQIREKTGLSQSKLAKLLNTNTVTLSRWENAHREPKLTFKQIKTLDILLKGMGLDMSDLPDSPFGEIKKISN